MSTADRDTEKPFLDAHRHHGALTGDATEPTANGYMVSVGCCCGVVFMRYYHCRIGNRGELGGMEKMLERPPAE